LRSNTKGYGGKTHYTDSQNSDTIAPSGRELYYDLHFSLQTTSPETFGYTLLCWHNSNIRYGNQDCDVPVNLGRVTWPCISSWRTHLPKPTSRNDYINGWWWWWWRRRRRLWPENGTMREAFGRRGRGRICERFCVVTRGNGCRNKRRTNLHHSVRRQIYCPASETVDWPNLSFLTKR